MISVRLAADRAACMPLLARALPFNVDDDGDDLAEMIGDAAVFEMVDGERLVGAFALEVNQHPSGRVLRVLAAGGEPGHDLTGAMVDAVTREAREHVGAHRIGCETRRRGLVKRLQLEGFELAGYILRKRV